MKITDLGFKHMLSLGPLNESSQPGIYHFYTWDEVNYFCGPPNFKTSFNQKGVYVELNPEQLKLLPKPSMQRKKQNSVLKKISTLYESSMFIEYLVTEKLYKTRDFSGLLVNLKHLSLSSEVNSPFKIVQQTRKAFHGLYSPLEPLNQTLNDLSVDTKTLWITAVPVVKNDVFKGILAGISNNNEYGLDSLELFNEYAQDLEVA